MSVGAECQLRVRVAELHGDPLDALARCQGPTGVCVAVQTQESVSRDAAAEVGVKLLLYEAWCGLVAFTGASQERLELVAYGLVEERVGRSPRCVFGCWVAGPERRRARSRGPSCASRRSGWPRFDGGEVGGLEV